MISIDKIYTKHIGWDMREVKVFDFNVDGRIIHGIVNFEDTRNPNHVNMWRYTPKDASQLYLTTVERTELTETMSRLIKEE